jgi:hypothetical protein
MAIFRHAATGMPHQSRRTKATAPWATSSPGEAAELLTGPIKTSKDIDNCLSSHNFPCHAAMRHDLCVLGIMLFTGAPS